MRCRLLCAPGTRRWSRRSSQVRSQPRTCSAPASPHGFVCAAAAARTAKVQLGADVVDGLIRLFGSRDAASGASMYDHCVAIGQVRCLRFHVTDHLIVVVLLNEGVGFARCRRCRRRSWGRRRRARVRPRREWCRWARGA